MTSQRTPGPRRTRGSRTGSPRTAQMRISLAADPDGSGATEPQRAGHGAVEVPVATAHERAAVVDRGHDAATAVADRHLRAARQGAVRYAVAGMEPTRSGAAVLVPRGVGLVVGVEHAGAAPGARVHAVAAEAQAQGRRADPGRSV